MEVPRTPPSHSSLRVPFKNCWFLLASMGGVLLVLAAYSNFFNQTFEFEDRQAIQRNLYVQDLESMSQLFSQPRGIVNFSELVAYRPMLSLSFSFDHWMADGIDPRQFHLTQFMLVAFLGLVFAVFCRFILDRAFHHWSNKYMALVAALWCCVHLANAEAFIEVFSRASLLATLGVVGSFVLYGRLPTWRPSQVYLLPMVIGTLAHPLGVLFAPLLLVYGLLFEKKLSCREIFSAKAWPKVRHAVGKTIPALFTGMGLLLFLDSVTPFHNTAGGFGAESLLIQPVLWLDYLHRFIFPMGVTPDIAWPVSHPMLDMRFFGGVIGAVVLVRLMWACSCKKELRPVAFGIMWFILGVFSLGNSGNLETGLSQPQVLFPFMGLMFGMMAWMAHHLRHWRRSSPQWFSLMIPVVILSGALVLGVHAIGTYNLHERGFAEETFPGVVGEGHQISWWKKSENS